MRKYVIEYRYQTPYMEDEDYGLCVVEADSEEQAVVEARRCGKPGWQGVDHVSPCEEDLCEYVVDLCNGCETFAAFVVEWFIPVAATASSDAYQEMIGEARSQAYEVIKRRYPDFYAKVLATRGNKDAFAFRPIEESMVIVRPRRWIKDGTQAYIVKVGYRSEGKDNYFFETVRAKDADEAVRIGGQRVVKYYGGEVISTLATRTAEMSSF